MDTMRGPDRQNQRQEFKIERPDPIPDDIRPDWADTKTSSDSDELILLDEEFNEIGRIPDSPINRRHYMGGPRGNTPFMEATSLARTNQGRLSKGLAPIVSTAENREEAEAADERRQLDPNESLPRSVLSERQQALVNRIAERDIPEDLQEEFLQRVASVSTRGEIADLMEDVMDHPLAAEYILQQAQAADFDDEDGESGPADDEDQATVSAGDPTVTGAHAAATGGTTPPPFVLRRAGAGAQDPNAAGGAGGGGGRRGGGGGDRTGGGGPQARDPDRGRRRREFRQGDDVPADIAREEMERNNRPYEPEDLRRAKRELTTSLNALVHESLLQGGEDQELRQRITDAADPAHVRGLVREMSGIRNMRGGVRPAAPEAPVEVPLSGQAKENEQRRLRSELEHSRRLTEDQKERFQNQISLLQTATEARSILESIVNTQDAAREAANRPPEAAVAPPEQLPQEPPTPPEWANQYFGYAPWRNYNPADYARIKPMTISEIQSNPRYQGLFGEFMIGLDENAQDLVQRATLVAAGARDEQRNPMTLTRDDLQFLRYAQAEFTLQMRRMERIARELKPEDLRMLIARTPALVEIASPNKPELTTAAFIDTMFHNAARNKMAFENFNNAFNAYKNVQATRRAQNSQREINALCERVNIPRENYESIIDPNDQVGTYNRLLQVIREGKRGNWNKLMDGAERILQLNNSALSLPGSSRDRAVVETGYARSLEPANIARIQEHLLRSIAPTLESAEFQQAMVRRAFALEHLAPVVDQGPQTQAEMRAQAAMMNREYAERIYDRELRGYAERQGRPVESFSDAERTDFRDSPAFDPPEARGGVARGWGILSMLARALQRIFLSNARSQIRVNPRLRTA